MLLSENLKITKILTKSGGKVPTGNSNHRAFDSTD